MFLRCFFTIFRWVFNHRPTGLQIFFLRLWRWQTEFWEHRILTWRHLTAIFWLWKNNVFRGKKHDGSLDHLIFTFFSARIRPRGSRRMRTSPQRTTREFTGTGFNISMECDRISSIFIYIHLYSSIFIYIHLYLSIYIYILYSSIISVFNFIHVHRLISIDLWFHSYLRFKASH